MSNRQADIIKTMKDREILFHLYLTQIILLILAIILGFILFDSFADFNSIWNISDVDILLVGGSVGMIVVIIDFIMMKVIPKRLYDDGGINERLFQHRNVIHSFFLCSLIAFSEEILFRGVIQTHFGIFIASSIFALMHVRYLNRWILLITVVCLSFLLGYIYEITENLWVTIFAHFIIDFVFALKIRRDFKKSMK